MVELVPEARSPERHWGSAPSSSPLVPPLGKEERLGPWSDLAECLKRTLSCRGQESDCGPWLRGPFPQPQGNQD